MKSIALPLLFLIPEADQTITETEALSGEGFSVYSYREVSEATTALAGEIEDPPIILIGPVCEKPELAVSWAGVLLSSWQIPLYFYCKKCDNVVLSTLDQVDHDGIIPCEAGLPYLLNRLRKHLSSLTDAPLKRLLRVTEESNRSHRQGQYGFLVSDLVDALIIENVEGEIIQVNHKACEILGLSREQILQGEIYKSGWKFTHEDLTPFPVEEHPHLVARETGTSVQNIILGADRPGRETLWVSASSYPVFSPEGDCLEGLITSFRDISEYISIRKNNLRLAAIFRNADWGVALGIAGSDRIEQVNPAYAQMHGYDIDEITGMPVALVFAEEDRFKIQKNIALAYRKGHHRFEAMHLRKDGSRFPTINAITIIYDHEGSPLYRAVNVVDITEAKYREQMLRDSMKQFREAKDYSEILFNKSPIAIYSLNGEGKVVHFNQKAEEITGYRKEDVLGRNFDLKCPAAIANEYKIKTKDNKEKIVEKYSSKLRDGEGRAIGEIESFIDITEWKRLEEYRCDIERIIRHDLKTPLNSILGFPKLMLTDETLSDEYREYLMIILLAGQNMLNLINASLNLYKLEQGNFQFTMEETEVLTIVKQIVKTLRDDCARGNHKIQIMLNDAPLEGDHKIFLKTEKSFLSMILLNLIKNAVEASPRGENVLLSISEGNNLDISIYNRGIIPESVREHFFEKNITCGKKQGNGLGTYSAKLMADALGADLNFTTGEREGTTLFLRL